MSAYTASTPPALSFTSTSSAEAVPTSPPLPINLSTPASTGRRPVTDRMVETVMIVTILRLEEELIPAQGEDDLLFIYAKDIEITHNVRRTLEIFDGDVSEAIDHIYAFVVDGLIGA